MRSLILPPARAVRRLRAKLGVVPATLWLLLAYALIVGGFLWWLAVSFVIAVALAEPPPGTDLNSPEARWYQSLAQPNTGYGCCSIADCRPVQFRQTPTGYEAFITKAEFPAGDDAWHAVPSEVVIRDKPNPTGEAVACWYAQRVRCFVLPSLT